MQLSRYALREDADRPGEAAPLDSEDVAIQSENERQGGSTSRLVCAACGRLVTSRFEALEVAGQHEHTFVNPVGFVYKIGCFGEAFCRAEGSKSANWSWFPGYHWQVVLCASCGVQLGWVFRSTPHTFYGLVFDRLAEVTDDISDT